MVAYAVNGKPTGAVGCHTKADPTWAGGSTFEAPPEKVLLGWGPSPGDTATLTLRLVSGEDVDGATVERPDVVIGAGVYEDTRGTRIVAGAEVPDRVEHGGRVWTLTSLHESDPGSRHPILTDRKGAQRRCSPGSRPKAWTPRPRGTSAWTAGSWSRDRGGAAWTGRRGCRGGPSSGARSTTWQLAVTDAADGRDTVGVRDLHACELTVLSAVGVILAACRATPPPWTTTWTSPRTAEAVAAVRDVVNANLLTATRR